MIEDAAHAIGARVARAARSATFGNVTAFSFYVTKNISTIEGGALVDRACRGRRGGRAARPARTQPRRVAALLGRGLRHYEVVRPGYKYNMTDVQAALGLHQLPRLDGWIDRRAELWERYDAAARRAAARDPASARAAARATPATSIRCCSSPRRR